MKAGFVRTYWEWVAVRSLLYETLYGQRGPGRSSKSHHGQLEVWKRVGAPGGRQREVSKYKGKTYQTSIRLTA